jgi:PIN domain nuclease of toxin-antitoxin system
MHIDTHIAVWLHTGAAKRLPPRVRRKLESYRLLISPVVQMELQLLHEVKRIKAPGHEVVQDIEARMGAIVQDASFARIVGFAAKIDWTRDPFDRMLVAHAKADDVRLLTKDDTIRKHFPLATWDE